MFTSEFFVRCPWEAPTEQTVFLANLGDLKAERPKAVWVERRDTVLLATDLTTASSA